MNARVSRAISATRIGHRGIPLLVFGYLSFVYGYWLAFPSRESANNATFRYFGTLLPMHAWAAVFAVVGIICLYHAFVRHDRFGYIAAVGLFTLWDLFSLIGVWFGDISIASVGIWTAFAVLVGALSIRPEPVMYAGRPSTTKGDA